MMAGHNQAALLELNGLLAKSGVAAKAPEGTAKQNPKTSADEPKKASAPRKPKRYAAALQRRSTPERSTSQPLRR